ncbi:DNA adenine methylase [Microbacterium sp. AK031]|uniref:DNA adenine methylase n=1 Tax=Microbacterium sp. AK031 TaxID=2723076 RepID=UPI002169808F|nr:DNA adenine methylase [Microbacterium sp. AK031]MCS3843520.1 DNA adenine methylase [Microbacterium sp. AK031]
MTVRSLAIRASRRYGALSPLRYPGGKAALAGLFEDLLRELELADATYVEPYAGGAGAGIALLREGIVSRLVVNDFDPAVHAFWQSIVHDNAEFVRLVETATLTVPEWRRQREIYRAADAGDPLGLGFAFFYLNRTNRSGVLTGGVIGGLDQTGNYKMDARFNRATLVSRLRAIGAMSDQITVRDDDGRSVIREFATDANAFLYVDPPYVAAGSRLYLNAFDARDHADLAAVMSTVTDAHWIMTYDRSDLIERLYRDFLFFPYELNYSARHPGKASELMIVSEHLVEAMSATSIAQSA